MKPFPRKGLKYFAPLLLVGLLIFGWTQRWQIHDWYKLRDYQPPAQIAQLASETTMTDKAKRLFYVYHPQLNDKTAFNANCKSSERTIVLGCFVPGTGIYVFSVTDERLAGVLHVTAAHEMLHAVYDRMNPGEKARVSNMLQQAFQGLQNERIRATMEDYRKNGADVNNELHSILATEVRNLPVELETYYKQYFNDRAAVVSYSERYEQAFTERKQKVADYDKQLDQLKNDIDSGQTALTRQAQNLEAERTRLDGLLAAKNYEQYNAGVNGYNSQVSSYNASVRRIRGQIDQHNALVIQRNEIVLEEGELVKAIDSRPDTIDAQ